MILGLASTLLSWLATSRVSSPRLRSVIWAGIFAALVSPILWIEHGAGFAPAFYLFAGLATSGGSRELMPGEIVVAAICIATAFLVVFSIAERIQGRQIRAFVERRDKPEAFRTADECVSYLEQIEGSKDGPFAVDVSNRYRESLSCVLGGALTSYVYRPAPGRGNCPSYSRGLRHGSPLSYTQFGKPEVAPPERCVPRETLVPVLTGFFDEGGRSRLIEWEGPG